MLEFSHVKLKRRGIDVLDDISLKLDCGVTSIVGRNGAGKTTLMNIAAGVIKPGSGSVSWGGKNLWGRGKVEPDFKRDLAWVPQSPDFPPDMPAKAFLQYVAWLKKVPRAHRDGAITHALEKCGAESLTERRLGRVSGGERQRVILAAALIGKPKLLLLDEPTTGLDPVQRGEYAAIIRGLAANTTIFYATHLIDDIVATADRLVVMRSGRVVDSWGTSRLSGDFTEVAEAIRRAI